ncbi:MAG: TraV family lipoprotein [bacterium]
MRKKIIAIILLLSIGIVPALLSGCATTYTGNKLLKLPSGKPVNDKTFYESLLLKKSILARDKTRLEESLINSPNTPIYIHSKILRMLVMPYVDTHNRLHTYQYIYFKIKKGGWLLGNYLMTQTNPKVFNPLAHIKNGSLKTSNITTYSKQPPKKTTKYSKPKGGFYNSVFQNDINAAKKENGQ